MKGLLIKDMYATWHYCKIVIFVVLACFCVYPDDMVLYFLMYPCMWVSLIPVTLMSLDEKNQWEKYALSLPISRAQIASSKFLICLIYNGITVLLMLINYLRNNIFLPDFSAVACTNIFFYIAGISLVSPAASLPFAFKFGSDKGKNYSLIGIIVVAALGSFLMENSGEDIISGNITNGFLMFVFSAAVFAFSWFISVKMYKKRDL